MARAPVWIGPPVERVEGLDKLQKKLAALPDGLLEAIAPAVDKGAEEFLQTAREACPINDLDPHPGDLKASGRKTAADTPTGIGKKVVFDAVDARGHYYAAHVEYGHKDAKGEGHVPAKPWFWPSYQHVKKQVRSRVSNAMSRAVRRMFAGPL